MAQWVGTLLTKHEGKKGQVWCGHIELCADLYPQDCVGWRQWGHRSLPVTCLALGSARDSKAEPPGLCMHPVCTHTYTQTQIPHTHSV